MNLSSLAVSLRIGTLGAFVLDVQPGKPVRFSFERMLADVGEAETTPLHLLFLSGS